MLKVGTQDASAELTDIGDDEGSAKLSPRNEVCRFGVVDHPIRKKVRLAAVR